MSAPVPAPPKQPAPPATRKRSKGFTAGARVASLDGRERGRVTHAQKNGFCTVEWENGDKTVVHFDSLLARYSEQSKNSGRKF